MVQVTEQAIMDWQLTANQNGHIACTQGGECLAGLVKAKAMGVIALNETAVLDATAHAIKFPSFRTCISKPAARTLSHRAGPGPGEPAGTDLTGQPRPGAIPGKTP